MCTYFDVNVIAISCEYQRVNKLSYCVNNVQVGIKRKSPEHSGLFHRRTYDLLPPPSDLRWFSAY